MQRLGLKRPAIEEIIQWEIRVDINMDHYFKINHHCFRWTMRQLRNVQCTPFPNYRLHIHNGFIQCCLKKLSVQDEPTSRDLGILSILQSIVCIAVGVPQVFVAHFDICNSRLHNAKMTRRGIGNFQLAWVLFGN